MTVDVLIPTYRRPVPLAVTLAWLVGQTFTSFRVVISDQSEDFDIAGDPAVVSVLRVLRALGREVEVHKHLPRRGMAEQRRFLLEQCRARYALFLDDDVILEPRVLERLVSVIEREGCGFAGGAVIGLSHLHDERPDEQQVELWGGRVEPEEVVPDGPGWERWRLHNAANPWHIQQRLGLSTNSEPQAYRVAWVGGCVLDDVEALRDVGGFSFWRELPVDHAGEDVLAQLRVMRRYGGCGVLPSGAFHQERETTIHDRRVDAARMLLVEPPGQK